MLSHPQSYIFALSPVGNAHKKLYVLLFWAESLATTLINLPLLEACLRSHMVYFPKFLQKCFSSFLSFFFFSFHFSITPFYKYSVSKGMLWHFCSKGAFSFISAEGYRIAHGIFNCELLAPSGRSYRQKYFYQVI